MPISEKVKQIEQENKELREELERMRQQYGAEYKPKNCQQCRRFNDTTADGRQVKYRAEILSTH